VDRRAMPIHQCFECRVVALRTSITVQVDRPST
jgi:hypothetical protein